MDILSSQAVGNIALLVAAIIGVGGNWVLYEYKRNKKRSILRQSLHAEIKSMEPVLRGMKEQNDIVTMDPIDPRSFLVDSVYRSSSGDLGLLTEEEVSALVEFYSTAISIQRVVGDDYHVAYEQVDRRNLVQKARNATKSLEDNGDIRREGKIKPSELNNVLYNG